MAEKNTVKEIEADLKRMLNMAPGKTKKPQPSSTTDEAIRDDLTKMLDKASIHTEELKQGKLADTMPKQAVMINNIDLEKNSKNCPPTNPEPKGKARQKQKKKGGQNDGTVSQQQGASAAVTTPVHHQKDPPAGSTGQEQDSPTQMKKKKKRKRKNKKSREGVKEEDSNTESDEERETEATPSNQSETTPSNKSETTVEPVKPANALFMQRYLDDLLTQAAMEELEKERIFPLKKKSLKFPHAKYFCRLCDYHCDNVPVCRQHAADARHRRRKEIMIQDKKLHTLPVPNKLHVAAMDRLIEEIYVREGLSQEQMEYREQLVQQLNTHLQQTFPDIQIRMYGSSLSGYGLKTSNLDIDLVVPGKSNPSHVLAKIYRHLRNSETYLDVNSNFMAKVPSVVFKSPCGEVNFHITIGTEMAYYTSRYLKIYARMDPRLLKLAVAFRHWARICQLDVQENGSLPAYAYSLMTVYYLQQCSPPVLPVIWKIISEEVLKRPRTVQDYMDMLDDLEKETWCSENTMTVGELWREMLFFYGVKFDLKECIICIRSLRPLPRAEKKWKSKRIAIEDPFSCKRNIARSLTNTRIYDYFYNCLRKACVYFSLPTSNSNISHYMETDTSPKRIQSDQTKTQCHTQDKTKQVDQNVGNTNKKTKDKKKGVASSAVVTKCSDDKDNKTNVIDSDLDQKKSELVESTEESTESGILDHSFLSSCKDGSDADRSVCEDSETVCDNTPPAQTETKSAAESKGQNKTQTLIDKSSASQLVSEESANIVDSKDSKESVKQTSQMHEDKDETVCKEGTKDSGASDEVSGDSSEVKEDEADDIDSAEEGEVEAASGSDYDGDVDLPRPKICGETCDEGEEYKFVFTLNTLTDGKGPSIFCQICEKEGHLKSACPDDVLPDVIQLPPMTDQHISLLNSVIQQVPRDFKMSTREIKERESILRNLESHVQETFPEAEMCLFGSSKNGFGFHQSDLDICVTFNGKKPEDLDFVAYIEAICKRLKSHRGLYNVFPITTAKVPIVKFKHRHSQLEGDISLYNILAQQNTRMLYTYSCVDPRVVTLVFAIKVFVKVCDIGDASKGSLSSYAYTLLMIHYLQHTKPPILPVLQELQEDDIPVPEYLIEGWNAGFYDKLEALPRVWSGFGKNKQLTGELWLGFFQYYLEEFNFFERVVSIRQFEPLTKFEKLWNGRCIAIEDPFDLSHNLGGALSRKMNQYILRTFVHARELYGIPISQPPPGFQTVQDYFFDQGQLTEGEPPSDRLCRVCNKIGHIAKDCPKVMARKEREANSRKMKEEQMKAENVRQAKQKNEKDRPMTGRSLSEPSQRDSSSKVRSQQFNRTHSYSNDSSQEMRPGMHTPDKYARNYPGSSSPQSPRYNPAHQDMPYNQHGNQGYYNSNQYYSGRHRDNRGWHQIQSPSYAGHSSAGSMHLSQAQQRPYSSGNSRHYSPANQNQSCYNRTPQHTQGHQQQQRQVHDSSMSGGQNYLTPTGLMFTNPANVYVPLVMPTAAMLPPQGRTTNTGQQQQKQQQPPAASSDTSPTIDNMSNRTAAPVYVQSWFPYHAGAPLYMNPAPVEAGDQAGTLGQGRVQGQNRVINVNKGPKPLPDVGITVKNEYYKGQDN